MAHWQNQGNRAPHPNPATARFSELLKSLEHEFNSSNDRADHHDSQLANQVAEMEGIRRKLWELEQAQIQMKKGYEQEIANLRDALDKRGPHHMGGPSHNHPPPPQVGHGSSNHFGGIMAGGGGQGGPGLAPPPQEPAQPQGLPAHLAQGPPGPPSGLPQPSYGSFPQQPSNGYTPQPPPPTQSPGPGNRPRGRLGGPPGPATPQQNTAAPYPGSPHVPRPTPPPGQSQNQVGMPLNRNLGQPNVGNCLGDLDIDQLRPEHKKEGEDWHCIFNPNLRHRALDIELVQTLPHKSVVCCVRFSHDGRYVATGCNKVAQIFDVEFGNLVATLQDNPNNDDGDLYIRSVCFSPDGKFLATGAEDKVIRVWDIQSQTVVHSFTGHEQDIYSLDYAKNGRLIASGSGDRTVRLWDLDSNTQVLQLLIDDGVTTVAISPDTRLLAAGSLDKSVRVWDISSGIMVERLEGEYGHKDSVYSVAFSPNGSKIVSGSLDKTIKMWDLASDQRQRSHAGRMIRTFEGHKDFVLSVALTPDNQWVLSGSKDRGVQFWDPATGEAALMLQGHKNSVISVAPSPVITRDGGGLFATGSGDLRARIWRYKRYMPERQ